MIAVRRARDRGHFDHGWLDTSHTFSFGGYQDRQHMGFRSLRVMNEDRIAPGHGFGEHGHRDMEILTWVLDGRLEHRDSLGNGAVLEPGEMQRMTAGSGIRHSEFNPSSTVPVHLYQIWLLPDQAGLPASWDQKAFEAEGRKGQLQLLASRDGRNGSLRIHQDADVHVATLDSAGEIEHGLRPGRGAWLQVLRGQVEVRGETLSVGDGASLSDESAVGVRAIDPSEVMLFDLA